MRKWLIRSCLYFPSFILNSFLLENPFSIWKWDHARNHLSTFDLRRCNDHVLHATQDSSTEKIELTPQVFTSSVSKDRDISTAIHQACLRAKAAIPEYLSIDLAIIHISSMYGGAESMKNIPKNVLEHCPQLRALVGTTVSGVVGTRNGRSIDIENEFCVQLTLASLPGVTVQSFHADALDSTDGSSFQFNCKLDLADDQSEDPVILLYLTPSFISSVDNFLLALDSEYPKAIKFGAIASTVSSLSKPLLFAVNMLSSNDAEEKGIDSWLFNSGVVGVALSGDIRAEAGVIQGARPFGPRFVCDIAEKNTIYSIRSAEPGEKDVRSPQKVIKSILSSTLGVESIAVKNSLLVGTPAIPTDTSKAAGSVDMVLRPIARGAHEDGSITLAGLEFSKNQEIQFFIRDCKGSKEEIEQKMSKLNGSITEKWTEKKGRVSYTLLYPSMDRGVSFYGEKSYESSRLFDVVGSQVGGFFTNGLISSLCKGTATTLFGSSTGYLLLGPKSGRQSLRVNQESGASETEEEEKMLSDTDKAFAVRRRDVGSGRALMSGEVQYSVVENKAQSRSIIEAMVWAKETEVDRARDRWPVGPLLNRVMRHNENPENKVRDLMASIKSFKAKSLLPIIGEIKGKWPLKKVSEDSEPFNPINIAIEYEKAGVAAIGLHTDFEYFGGKFEDLESIRHFTNLPILCMDLIVYVYQLYQARLGGADAVRLVAAALPPADLAMLHKVAMKIGMQAVVTVSTEGQMREALKLEGVRLISITQRDLGNWNFDESRVERIMRQPEVNEILSTKVEDAIIIVEGCVDSADQLKHFKSFGFGAAIVGEALLTADSIGESVRKLAGKS